MMTTREENEYLTIQLLSYRKSNELTEEYYFLEMSTLQATILLPQRLKIITSDIVAYTDENKYLDRNLTPLENSMTSLFRNSDYYIHNCESNWKMG
jgi:hypothetical protein